MTPRIGDDVYYVAPGSADGTYPPAVRAAKVTVVHSTRLVDLIVFNPTGIHFVQAIMLDEGENPAPYTWHAKE